MKHLRISVSFRFDNLLKFDCLSMSDRYRISTSRRYHFSTSRRYQFSTSHSYAQLKISLLKNGTGTRSESLIFLADHRSFVQNILTSPETRLAAHIFSGDNKPRTPYYIYCDHPGHHGCTLGSFTILRVHN